MRHLAPPELRFNVHAGTTVAGGNRDALERLLRYGARPVLALDRRTRLGDGRFAYRMKYPIGTKTHRVMDPTELLARLAAVVAPPRYPLVRYAGVFAPSAKWRAKICPGRPTHRKRCCAKHAGPERSRRDQPVPPPNANTPTTLGSPRRGTPQNVREAVTGDPLIERPIATAPTFPIALSVLDGVS